MFRLMIVLVSLSSMTKVNAQVVYRSSSIIPKYYFGESRISTYAMKQIVGQDEHAARQLRASYNCSIFAWSGFAVSTSSLFWRYVRKNNGARNVSLQSGLVVTGFLTCLVGSLRAVNKRNFAIQVYNDSQPVGGTSYISPSSQGLGICFHF